MRYHKIDKCDLLNGKGIRVVLWLSHCEHKCKGCHNPQTWNGNSGMEFDIAAKNELFEALSKDHIQGVTFSGGDPLSTLNRMEAGKLIEEIKETFPDKDIWVYTGYTFEEVKELECIEHIDVLVDGKYEESLNKPSPEWCGSTNQRIIDVKATLKNSVITVV